MKIQSLARIIMFSLTILLLNGCTSWFASKSKPVSPFPYQNNVDAPKLGLALSGGGLRASAYSLGVLQQLHKLGLLQKVDIVSSVSGGGYTAYELFMNDLKFCATEQNKDGTYTGFGDGTFRTEKINKSIFRHYYNSNFVEYHFMLPTWIGYGYSLSDLYECRIIRKYGYNDVSNEDENFQFPYLNRHCDLSIIERQTIADLQTGRKMCKKLPEWVINTTYRFPYLPEYRSSDVFEFSLFEAGSPAEGYHSYTNPFNYPVSKLVTISAAAVKMGLSQNIENPFNPDERIRLSDGGHSDNIGVFSLIRRGVKEIIVVDAEMDSEYQFEAYGKLKKRLGDWGLTIYAEDIESIRKDKAQRENLKKGSRLNSPLFIGRVIDTNGKLVSTLYYIKMSNSIFVDNQILSNKDKYSDEELSTENEVREVLEEHKDKYGYWDSSVLLETINYPMIYKNAVNKYPKALKKSLNIRLSNLFGGLFEFHFPHYSTFDQSFFNDQYLAFVGLGYLSAKSIHFNGQEIVNVSE